MVGPLAEYQVKTQKGDLAVCQPIAMPRESVLEAPGEQTGSI